MGNTANRTLEPTYVDEYGRALELEDAGDLHGAIALLEDLCTRYPTDARVRAQVSHLRIRRKDYGGALSAAQEALRCDPEHLHGHVNAGVAARGLGDLATSRRYLERAVRIAPDDPDAQLHLGWTLARLREIDAAMDAFIRAIGETHRVPRSSQWIIEQGINGLAALTPPSPPEEPLRSLHEGARWLVAGKLARACQCLGRAREGPYGPGMPAIREAAETLLGEVWRRHARMTQAPGDAERPCAPLLHLRP